MTEQARNRLMEAVTGAVDAYVEDVALKAPDTGHCDEDWDRPMDYEEFDDLCCRIPSSLISYVTGISMAHVRNLFSRRSLIPQDVASKMRRLSACIDSLAAEPHKSLRGRPRKSSLPPDTGKRQQRKSK